MYDNFNDVSKRQRKYNRKEVLIEQTATPVRIIKLSFSFVTLLQNKTTEETNYFFNIFI